MSDEHAEPEAASGTTEHGWPRRDPVDDETATRLLREGEVEVVGRMPWSSNATYLVDVVKGTDRMLAVYKPRRGERRLWDFPAGTLVDRELAAYQLAEAMGWDIVPDTVLRDGPAGEGSMQRFVDHDPEDHYFALLEEGGHEETLRRFAVFDVIANNTDRKAGHVIRAPDGHLWGIDHGVCFNMSPKLRTVIWDFGGERLTDDERRATQAVLDGLDRAFGDALRGRFTAFEIDACKSRAEYLLETGRLPAVDPGYHSYPWPLV